MVQILQGKDTTLAQLIDEFGLQLAEDEDFFSEWQHDLPELSDLEKQSLNEVKAVIPLANAPSQYFRYFTCRRSPS
ncbi:hypothetical protein [Nostoc sp. C052]|uniref:hypothetical protein n=1 Tax=Nostoc sp. C052 TaxID=2576902 RepID=UPI0021186E7A|nr:hypothetical protein [Nostoc sp. C052]